MSGTVAKHNAGNAQRIREEDEKLVGEITRLTRRRIYFNRLVGDDVLAPKINTQRGAPIAVVIRFVIYAAIATWVIWARSAVPLISEVNQSLRQAITEESFKGGTRPEFFNDIDDTEDLVDWLQTSLLSRVGIPDHPVRGAQLLLNRIMPPLEQFCWRNASAIVFTMNRMSTTTQYEDTVTDSFNQLYPETWQDGSHMPRSELEYHTTSPLNRSYFYSPEPGVENIPDHLFGTSIDGRVLTPDTVQQFEEVFVQWHYTHPCSNESAQCGFAGRGGYVAMIVLLPDPSGNTGSVTQLVLLLGGESQPADSRLGLCGSLSVSNVMTLSSFIKAGFISDWRISTMVVSFSAYNPNYQTVSNVAVSARQTASGFVPSPRLTMETVTLDFYSSYLPFLEIAYLIATLFYFLFLCTKFYRNYLKTLMDPWAYINFASMVCSTLSLVFWFVYSSKAADFHAQGKLPLPTDIAELADLFQHFKRAGALATLTIYIRILQLLAESRARVKLLLNTLSVSMFNMVVYVLFISIIFVGCLVFANTYFSAYSSSFSSFPDAMLTCTLMLFGDTSRFFFERHPPLELLFYLPYMIFFFVISVQMFNAIINYSYNRVSEKMEPAFERERMEKRRKGAMGRSSMKLMMFCPTRNGLPWPKRAKKGDGEGEKDDMPDGKGAKKGSGAGANASKVGEKVDQGAKDAVEEKIARERNQKAPETICSMVLYLFFAIAYLMFLWVNLKVEDNSMVYTAITRAIFKEPVSRVLPDGDIIHSTFHNITDPQDMTSWISQALPAILFENNGQPITTLTDGTVFPPPGRSCIAIWNCVVQYPEEYSVNQTQKVVRLSYRVAKRTPNQGGISNSTPEEDRFVTGAELASFRTSDSPLTATSGKVDFEERGSFNLSYAGESFCERVKYGDGGFDERGGIVCMMDADESIFKQQMAALDLTASSASTTGAITIEFLTYNPSVNLMSHCRIHFTHDPSGRVIPEFSFGSFVYIDIREWKEIYWDLSLQMIPGFAYLFLTFTFISFMIKDLQAQITRRRRYERRRPLWIILDYFLRDTFNAIDLVSFCISISSSVLYIIWLIEETQLSSEPRFSDALDNVKTLVQRGLTYRQLSAVNALVIFIRPVKFMRESPRIAMFNLTFWNATEDTSWFVVMFFTTMTGFVMFAYVSFGTDIAGLSTVPRAFNYCFYHVLGVFDFSSMLESDPLMAWLWFVPFLFIFYCFFLNMFFAIIDRNFLTIDPPPVNFKRKLKPILSRFCRWVEWDEDFFMDVEKKGAKGKPTSAMSRRQRVHKIATEIQQIWESAQDEGLTVNAGPGGNNRKSKVLSDICEPDERMNAVLMWSRDQAKVFVDEYQERLNEKQSEKNDEVFLSRVTAENERAKKAELREMEAAERQKRYAIQVHEKMAMKDQETLARYIMTLERKIEEKMLQKHRLQVEVQHLRAESEKMRFTDVELKASEDEEGGMRLLLQQQKATHKGKTGNGGGSRALPNGTGHLLDLESGGDDDDEDDESSSDSSDDHSAAEKATMPPAIAPPGPRGVRGLTPDQLALELD